MASGSGQSRSIPGNLQHALSRPGRRKRADEIRRHPPLRRKLITHHLSLISLLLLVWTAVSAFAAPSPPPTSSSQTASVAATSASPGRKGSTEWGWTSGGGARIAGGAREGNFWATELRWGRVLTAPHGP